MSPAELRRELSEQRARADEAERRLEALLEEKAALEQRVARLESRVEALLADVERLGGGGSGDDDPRAPDRSREPMPAMSRPNPGGVDAPGAGGDGASGGRADPSGRVPTNPLGSPTSLYFALQLSYEDAIDEASDPGEPLSPRSRREAVERWARRVKREIRGETEWLVRLSPAPTPSDPSGELGRVGMLRVLDERNLGTIGSPIRVVVPSRYRDRISEAGAEQLWDLRLRLEAEPVFNPRRERAGPFNFPLLIGPYAEFGFDLDWLSLNKVSEEDLAERRAGSGSGSGGGPGG
jgi:hypothetical protein